MCLVLAVNVESLFIGRSMLLGMSTVSVIIYYLVYNLVKAAYSAITLSYAICYL